MGVKAEGRLAEGFLYVKRHSVGRALEAVECLMALCDSSEQLYGVKKVDGRCKLSCLETLPYLGKLPTGRRFRWNGDLGSVFRARRECLRDLLSS